MQNFLKQSRLNPKLYNHRFSIVTESVFAVWTVITLGTVFNHFTGGRNDFKFLADISLAKQDNLRTAYQIDPLFF